MKPVKFKPSAKKAPVVAPVSNTQGVEVEPEGQPVEGLDKVYANPEFSKAADNLINVIERQIVFTEARPYHKDEVLDTANKILQGRMK